MRFSDLTTFLGVSLLVAPSAGYARDGGASDSQPVLAPVTQILTPWPAVLKCARFGQITFNPPIPEDVVEWWPPDGPPVRLDTDTSDRAKAGQVIALPSGFASSRPIILRFLRHPTTAMRHLDFSISCADGTDSVSWRCDAGTCNAEVTHSDKRRWRDRYLTRWICGPVCKSPGKLDRLLTRAPKDLKAESTLLVGFAHDVAAELIDFVDGACKDGRCSGRVADARAALTTVAKSASFGDAAIAPSGPNDRSTFRMHVNANALVLGIECEFFRYAWDGNPQTACKATLADGTRAVFKSVLNESYSWHRRIDFDGAGSIDASLDDDLDRSVHIGPDVNISGVALNAIKLPSIELPAPVVSPVQPMPVLAIRWPKRVDCAHFEKIQLDASEGVAGIEWRANDYVQRLLLADEPIAEHDTKSFHALPGRAQLSLRDSFPIGVPAEIVPISVAGSGIGPKKVQIGIQLACRDRPRINVAWSCKAGTCTTSLIREAPRPEPVGGSYLGPKGWDCGHGCAHAKDFSDMVAASPRALKTRWRDKLLQLGRDLAKEMVAVIDDSCSDLCSAQMASAATPLRELLANPSWRLSAVKWLPADGDSDDGERIRSWTAEMGVGSQRLAVTCKHRWVYLGMRMSQTFADCSASFLGDGSIALTYSAHASQPQAKQYFERLEEFHQRVELMNGALTVRTGYAYHTPEEASDEQWPFPVGPVERYSRGPVSGYVEISGSALVVRPTSVSH